MLFDGKEIQWKSFEEYLNEDVDSSPHQFEFFVKNKEAFVVHFFNGERKAYSIADFYKAKLKVSSDNVMNKNRDKNAKDIEEVNGSYFIKLLLDKLSKMKETRYAYDVINSFGHDEVKMMKYLIALFFPETKAPVDFSIGRTLSQASIRISLETGDRKAITPQNYTADEVVNMIKEKVN